MLFELQLAKGTHILKKDDLYELLSAFFDVILTTCQMFQQNNFTDKIRLVYDLG